MMFFFSYVLFESDAAGYQQIMDRVSKDEPAI